MVSEKAGVVLGYMVYEILSDRYELLRLAVAAKHQGKGVGRQLVERLTRKRTRRRFVSANVRESNLPAQKFLRSLGFLAVRVLRGEFGSEDGYRFEYTIQE